MGVDLGQRRDFTAVAIVERRESWQFDHVSWNRERVSGGPVVRHLERMRLGMPYTEVARRVAALAQHAVLGGAVEMIVDATGLGMPVVDMLRAAGPGCRLTPVVITSGAAQRFDGRVWHVPRVDLIAGLQGLLERGELRISREMREASALVRELVDMGGKGHDDLVFAVALACWAAGRGVVGEVGKRLI